MKLIVTNHFKLIALLLTLSLSTCKIDDGPQPCADTNTYHNLSIEEVNITPYFTNPLFDTISFASNTGDTLTFALQKIDTTWYTVDENTNPYQQCSYYHHYQNITAKYKTIKGLGNFTVSQFLKDHKDNRYVLEVHFDNTIYAIFYPSIGLERGSWYLPEIKLNNYVFKDITRIEYDFNSHSNVIYVNKSHGVFKIEYSNTKNEWVIIHY